MTIDEAIDKLQNIIIDDYGYVYSYIAFEEAHQIAAIIEQQAQDIKQFKTKCATMQIAMLNACVMLEGATFTPEKIAEYIRENT